MVQPHPRPIVPRSITWEVINREGRAPAICLSSQEFQDLSLFMQDIRRWMQQSVYVQTLYEQDVQLTNEQIRQLRQTGLSTTAKQEK